MYVQIFVYPPPRLPFRQYYMKFCSFHWFGFCINLAAVIAYYFTAKGQTNTSSGNISWFIKPLKNYKYLFCEFRRKTNSIILENNFNIWKRNLKLSMFFFYFFTRK